MLFYILYEFVFLFFPKYSWEQSKAVHFEGKNDKLQIPILKGKNNYDPLKIKEPNPVLKFISLFLSVFIIIMCFVKSYTIDIGDGLKIRVGVALLSLGLIKVFALLRSVKQAKPFSAQIWLVLFIDGILSIIIASHVINPIVFFSQYFSTF